MNRFTHGASISPKSSVFDPGSHHEPDTRCDKGLGPSVERRQHHIPNDQMSGRNDDRALPSLNFNIHDAEFALPNVRDEPRRANYH
jgi:hypothetical protein